jgi:NAD(P)-dependent dehydrogenase (short-subunit alcohol dehydrogenase family)
MSKVILITGGARGMGVDIAKAALAAGHRVVATARHAESVTRALGTHERLLPLRLDVTSPADAEEAVRSAVERFARIDVLINDAGN